MHPIAFHLGPLAIHWYGVMVALAFIAGLWTASRRAPLTGINGEKIADLVPWLIVGTILGARTLYVISYWREQFANQPWWEIFMVQHGGLVFYGGLIGATFTGILYVRRHRLALWKVADILAPSVALGYVFGRIGCLLNGCCFGRVCARPWAIQYPVGHETHPVGEPAVLVHPTQIYDALLNFGLYLALAWLYRRKKFDGQVFATYLMGYAVTRSVAEIFRGDYSAEHLYAGLTPAHLVSIATFGAGLVLWFVLSKRAPQKRG